MEEAEKETEPEKEAEDDKEKEEHSHHHHHHHHHHSHHHHHHSDHAHLKCKEKEGRREKRLQEISLLRTIPYSDHQRWWTAETVAVVTGGNRGIGFELVRQLANHGLTVIQTSRDSDIGTEAAKVLQEGGLNVFSHQLDIRHQHSITAFCDWLKETYGGADILINNAGVNFNCGSENSVEHAKDVITTNYYGTKSMIKAMLPLMKPSAAGARIINVSSKLAKLNGTRNRVDDNLREQLSDLDALSEEVVDNVVSTFLEQVEEGTWKEGGWPQSHTDYAVSKIALNAYTRVLSKQLAEERAEGEKIYMNCYCPGWVKTAMTGWSGNVTAEDAADTAIWLALLPDQAITGKFFSERREIKF